MTLDGHGIAALVQIVLYAHTAVLALAPVLLPRGRRGLGAGRKVGWVLLSVLSAGAFLPVIFVPPPFLGLTPRACSADWHGGCRAGSGSGTDERGAAEYCGVPGRNMPLPALECCPELS